MTVLIATLALLVVPLLLIVSDRRPWAQRQDLWLSEIAYREGRQCYGGVYSHWAGPPERCAYPEDHYGRCEA